MGPMAYIQHLLSGNRLPFTAAYFGSIFMTLYFSLGVSQTSNVCVAVLLTEITNSPIASKYDFDLVFRDHPDCLSALVSHQLFPHGF